MAVKIHGKNYITVDERVEEFHKRYPNGSIKTDLVEFDGERVITKTTAIPDVENPERRFTGWAYEMVGSTNINKTSALENCETSSCGRALGFLAIGLNGSIATADEVQNAIDQQKNTKVTEQQKDDYQKLLAHKCFTGKKKEMNDWWVKIYDQPNPNKSADVCLKKLKKRIDEFENPKKEEEVKVATANS